MARRAGMPGVREIAAAAGVSPSLVGYRFGSMDGLRQTVLARAHDQEASRWRERMRVFLCGAVSRDDLAGLLNELLLSESWPDDRLAALRWLRMLRRVRSEGDVHGIFPESEGLFWAELSERLALPMGADRTLAAFFHGLAFGQLIGAREMGFQAWSSTLVERFTRRLLGHPIPGGAADSAWRQIAADHTDGMADQNRIQHPTRQAILDAAVRILVEDGTSGLTHRRLAAAAGVSVSSVIHFFETRRTILREAYSLLNARVRDRALVLFDDPQSSPGALTASELARRLTPVDQIAGRANQLELAGLLNAMFEASRDSETRQIGLSLFARSGETSRRLLRRLRGFEEGGSWLDAQIFRLTSNGLMMLSLQGQAAEAATEYPVRPDELADTLSLLFGKP